MKIEGTLEEQFEQMGDDHISSSEETPLRKDAFILSDDEKMEQWFWPGHPDPNC